MFSHISHFLFQKLNISPIFLLMLGLLLCISGIFKLFSDFKYGRGKGTVLYTVFLISGILMLLLFSYNFSINSYIF